MAFSGSNSYRGSQIQKLLRHSGLFAVVVIIVFVPRSAIAQQKSDFGGDYIAISGPLHVKLHITESPDGTITANVDSPDQNLFALPCSNISINGPALSFDVPNVNGEWMGTLSADHNSLAGIWKMKQGPPIPLNFTRSKVSRSNDSSAPAAPHSQDQPASTVSSGHHPPCSSTMGMNYWDGSGWKLMTAASHLGGDEGVSFKQGLKNPFNPMGGRTRILTFKNAAAALTLDAKPSFCTPVLPGVDPTVIMIGSLDVKKDHRQLETCVGACASSAKRSTDDWMPPRHIQPVEIERLSDTTVEITPKEPLKPGQYLLGGPGALIAYYDFGVEEPRTSR